MSKHLHPAFRRAACCCVAWLAAGIGGAVASDAPAPLRLSAPVTVTGDHETFGEPLPSSGPALTLATLLTEPEGHTGRELIIRTRVAQVCQKKGCFFIAQEGPHAVRVSFKDYGFFVPTDIGGRTVPLAGERMRHEVSAERAAHYNADAGDADAVQPGMSYEIVATSVRVPLR